MIDLASQYGRGNSAWRKACENAGEWPSASGVLLGVTCLSVAGSAIKAARIDVGGLLVHPYLVAIAICAPFVMVSRFHLFPARVLAGTTAFLLTFSLSAFGGPIGEIVKVASALLTVFVIALLVRNQTDFLLGAGSLLLATVIITLRSIGTEGSSEGFNPLDEVANKNAYSLYVLPAVLLGGFVLLRFRTIGWLGKSSLVAAILILLVGIFTSGNRSGWLGAGVIGAMLLKDRAIRGLLLVMVLTCGLVYWLTNYADTSVAERRLKQTQEGYRSDNLRLALMVHSFWIAIENPIAGTSPHLLPMELDRKLAGDRPAQHIDPHNVFSYIMAGSGLMCFASLLYIGWSLCTVCRLPNTGIAKPQLLRSAQTLLRMLVALWFVRGMFSREILYAPGFCISLGLALGLSICALEVHRKTIQVRLSNHLSVKAA